MRLFPLIAVLLSTPGAAQPIAPPPAAAVAVWNPAAPYVTAGQDESGYRAWYLAAPWRAAQVKAFNAYLASSQVAGVVPTWQLLRTATSWQKCGGEPFEIPPSSEWPHIVQTLRYIHGFVIPAIGPVEPVSAYRNPHLNVCAGGAPESAHKHYSAIDMVPLRPISREQLMRTLCFAHAERGPEYATGLGFYAYHRFHVDSTKFRRWGTDPAAGCPPIIRPEDLATVPQPVPTEASMQAPVASTTATQPPAPLTAQPQQQRQTEQR